MLKKIKFRCWRKNEMLGQYNLETMLSVAKEVGFHLNAPSTVEWMQFIGIYDKDGEEIYEGDWLDIIDPNGEKMSDSQCVFYDDRGGYFIEDRYESYPIGYAISQGYEVKVVGNKYVM